MTNKHSHHTENTISKKLADHQYVTLVMQTAVDDALLKHKQAGNPICIWQDDKVVWIPAAEIFMENAATPVTNEILEKIRQGDNPIRALRKYRGLTQLELATKVTVSKQYISQLENFEKTGSVQILQKIAGALCVSLEILLSNHR